MAEPKINVTVALGVADHERLTKYAGKGALAPTLRDLALEALTARERSAEDKAKRSKRAAS